MASVSQSRPTVDRKSLRVEGAASGTDFEASPVASGGERQQNWRRLLAGPSVLAILGILALALDMPLAHWLRAKHYPSDLKKLFDLAEVFGHGFGAVFILFTVWVLAPQVRPRLPRVICAVLGAGITGTLFKMLLARQRPNRIADFVIGPIESFGNWFPLFSNHSGWQSFPSGHSAMAAGLAVALTSLFPRGKWLFTGLAVLVMLQRMTSGYHFLSDTLWGAGIGWLFASIMLSDNRLTRPFQRMEQRLAAAV